MLPTFSQAPERGPGGGLDRAKYGVFPLAWSLIAFQLVAWVRRGGSASRLEVHCGGQDKARFRPQEGD